MESSLGANVSAFVDIENNPLNYGDGLIERAAHDSLVMRLIAAPADCMI
jgi:hypothetical protein